MPDSKPLSIAIFGAGRMGRIHGQTVARSKLADLRYIVDPNVAAMTDFQEKHGATPASEEDVFKDDTVDAIVIASVASTHTHLIERATDTGKAIFCEKPIGRGLDQVREAVTKVEAAKTPFLLAFNRRFDPDFRALKARLDDGEIGAPELLVLTSRDPSAPPINYIQECGGILRETTVHDIDMARWMTSEEPISVYAAGSGLTRPDIVNAGEIDTVAVTLRFKSGAIAVINNSWRAAYGYDQRLEVLGSKGQLQLANMPIDRVQAWSERGLVGATPQPFFLERYAAAYKIEMQEFLEALVTGTSPQPSARDGLKALEIAEAAVMSLSTGNEVKL